MTASHSGDVVEAAAELSPCARYRYSLTRRWGPGVALGFVMLNPSTADAEQDDPTIRRCVGFARREGCDGIEVVNLFAWRATKPTQLISVEDPIGPGNGSALRALFEGDGPVVVAWGARYGEIIRRRQATERSTSGIGQTAVIELLAARHSRELLCLGTSRDGSPRHPLMVRASQPLNPWTASTTTTTCASEARARKDPRP
jgi:hypothetical protein